MSGESFVKRSHLIAILIVALAFAGGWAVGRYSTPHSRRSASSASSRLAARLLGSLHPNEGDPFLLETESRNGSASVGGKEISDQAIVAALRNAVMHPADRRSYLDVSKLIDSIDPKKIRGIIEAFQSVPNQREKSIYLAMLVSRWAEADPQAALAYAQSTGTPSERPFMAAAAVRTWAEKDSAAANAWVQQLPPGQERERAQQAVISALAEADPEAALTMLQSLPGLASARQGFYWPIFSHWANSDPVAAAQRAVAALR